MTEKQETTVEYTRYGQFSVQTSAVFLLKRHTQRTCPGSFSRRALLLRTTPSACILRMRLSVHVIIRAFGAD